MLREIICLEMVFCFSHLRCTLKIFGFCRLFSKVRVVEVREYRIARLIFCFCFLTGNEEKYLD